MKIGDVLKPGGRGVIGTASKGGVVNERAAATSPGNPEAVKHVAYFKVVETRPLV